jgi:hypothetical protein
MVDLETLRAMTPAERHELKRALAELDDLHPLSDPRLMRRRQLGITLAVSACLFLIVWIGFLAVTLQHSYTARNWNVAWAGFDVLLLSGLAATAWASWHRRQIMIFFAAATGILLICDAWFDITLDWGTHDVWASVFNAVCGEIPLAVALFTGVRRIAKTSVEVARIRVGLEGPTPPLHKVPLFTTDW